MSRSFISFIYNWYSTKLYSTYLFYELCMTCIQHPECCQDSDKVEMVVMDLLSGKKSKSQLDSFMVFYEQEIKDLIVLDVIYFQHLPRQCHVYGSDGTVYYDTFKKAVIDKLKDRFRYQNVVYCDHQLEIISNILIPTEYVLHKMQ